MFSTYIENCQQDYLFFALQSKERFVPLHPQHLQAYELKGYGFSEETNEVYSAIMGKGNLENYWPDNEAKLIYLLKTPARSSIFYLLDDKNFLYIFQFSKDFQSTTYWNTMQFLSIQEKDISFLISHFSQYLFLQKNGLSKNTYVSYSSKT